MSDFDKAMNILDSLDEEVKAEAFRNQSLVVIGQRMANLLGYFNSNPSVIHLKNIKDEAKELVMRWEKEFKR